MCTEDVFVTGPRIGVPRVYGLCLREADACDTHSLASDFPWFDGGSPLSLIFLLQLWILNLKAAGQKTKLKRAYADVRGLGSPF